MVIWVGPFKVNRTDRELNTIMNKELMRGMKGSS